MDQITDYATLQSAVVGTLHREGDTDFIASVPLWIQLLEAELSDRLLLKDMESDETLTLTTDVNYVALPSGFISPIALWLIVSSERTMLQPVLPEQLPYYSTSGQPRNYAIDAGYVRFDRPADSAYSARLRCLKRSNLSDSNTSNALLLARPTVYLYGALMQACLGTMDDDGARKWRGLMDMAIVSLKAAENRARAVPLRSELSAGRRHNIITGD